jgi:hypothetical protein
MAPLHTPLPAAAQPAGDTAASEPRPPGPTRQVDAAREGTEAGPPAAVGQAAAGAAGPVAGGGGGGARLSLAQRAAQRGAMATQKAGAAGPS